MAQATRSALPWVDAQMADAASQAPAYKAPRHQLALDAARRQLGEAQHVLMLAQAEVRGRLRPTPPPSPA